MRRIWTAATALLLLAGAAPAARGGTVLAGPTVLTSGRTIVPVRLARGLAAPAGRAELVIEGLAFDAPSGVLYQVSLQGRGGQLAPLGLLNLYNLTAPVRGAASAAGLRTMRFDATEALRRLGGQATALVFEPTTGVTGSGVHAEVNPHAGVRFDSVSIRWR